jgi:hypothetical protein
MPFLNKVRLPFYVTQPQFITDANVYIKGDGTRLVTNSVTNKQYKGVTDWMPEKWHERLAIAMRHSVVFITSEKFQDYFRQDGDYEIEWQDFLDYPIAPAKFKGFVDGWQVGTDPCGKCAPEIISVRANDDVVPATAGDGDTIVIDVRANDALCCDTPVFAVVGFDTSVVDSASINSSGILTINLKATVVSGTYNLVTYSVTCGDETDTAVVTGTLAGTAEPECLPPTMVAVAPLSDGSTTAHATWTNPLSFPAFGLIGALYHLVSGVEYNVDAFVITNPLTTSYDFTGLVLGDTYRFRIYAKCNDLPLLASETVEVEFVQPFATANPEMDISVYPSETDLGGGNSEYAVNAVISAPAGITSTSGITIFGHITIDVNIYPFFITIPALGTSGTVVIGTYANGLGTTIDDAFSSPTTITGSDSLTYDIILTI